jgi:hypothetical protein
VGTTVKHEPAYSVGKLLVGIQEGVCCVLWKLIVVGGYTGTKAGVLVQESLRDDDDLIRV